MAARMRIAVLDDWQAVAKQSADWSGLQQRADVVFFEEPFTGPDQLAKALAEFDIIIAMRERGEGKIINISSLAGLVPVPFWGYYNASKFAVEGLSEALAKEVEPLGIRVTVVEPGPFRTDWAGRSLKQVRDPIEAYAKTSGARRAQISGYSGKQPGDPARAAQAIIQIVESPAPPMNLVLGKDGLKRVRDKLDNFSNSLRQWEAVTVGADFPET